jgi:hypothetical protein
MEAICSTETQGDFSADYMLLYSASCLVCVTMLSVAQIVEPRMVDGFEWWIAVDAEGSDRILIEGVFPVFA